MAVGKKWLSKVYGWGASFKNALYDFEILDQVRLPVPVLSVGNLSVGGTGKTPVVQSLLKLALQRNLKVAVVSRNYKARSRGIHRVDPARSDGAFFYGDEAFLLARSFPEVSVWTGPRKFLTAQEAIRHDHFDLVIVDDGFQHRALFRDFDLVLLDCTASESSVQLLPWGRLREDFHSLQRASAVALTKANWASESEVEKLRSKLPLNLEAHVVDFQLLQRNEIPLGAKVLVVSGIANPQSFEKSLQSLALANFEIGPVLNFPDHHDYTKSDVQNILQRMKSSGCAQILTTDKDFVKLQTFPEISEFLNPMDLTIQFRSEPEGIYAFLDKCIRH